MTFEFPGYDLNFIQRKQCRDSSAHLFTFIYKFSSPITGHSYVLNADYHEEDVFVVKFYSKRHKGSDNKYNKILNKGDLGNILITCLRVVPMLLNDYPTASFGFIGSISIDKKRLQENYNNNQRFRVYSYIATQKIGSETFQHYRYSEISGYLLVNRKNENTDSKEADIKKMFAKTYNEIPY